MTKLLFMLAAFVTSSLCFADPTNGPIPPELPNRSGNATPASPEVQSKETEDSEFFKESEKEEVVYSTPVPAPVEPARKEEKKVDCNPVKAAPKTKDVKLTNNEAAKVSCKCEAAKCSPKVLTKTKTVYVDKPVIKTITKTKPVNVYVDRPVTQTVERLVEKPVFKKHELTLMLGRGPDGFYPVLETKEGQTDRYGREYKYYKTYGFVGGLSYQYFFHENFGVGIGAMTNETVFGTGSLRWGN